jgi:hypothetical protein
MVMKKNLALLSNSELISQLEKLVAHEKETTTDIVRHLAEVESRKLYLELGYSSLFDYSTRGLGYSDSAALRRIKVARAGAKVPEIFDYLAEDKVSLSALTVCSGVLVKEDGVKVLEQLKGKTIEEAEWLTASYSPVTAQSVKDKIKKVVVTSPTPQEDLFSAGIPTESLSIRSGGQGEEKFKISFSVGNEFMQKLNRAQELMFEGNAEDILLENIFGEALELYINKHCPKEKQIRREQREAKKEKAEIEVIDEAPLREDTIEQEASRYIPAGIRDRVLQRDNYQCSFVSPGGIKCGCRKNLEIDHIYPFALGGKTEVENLRVLCAPHNLHAARIVFGAEFVEQKIHGTQ